MRLISITFGTPVLSNDRKLILSLCSSKEIMAKLATFVASLYSIAGKVLVGIMFNQIQVPVGALVIALVL